MKKRLLLLVSIVAFTIMLIASNVGTDQSGYHLFMQNTAWDNAARVAMIVTFVTLAIIKRPRSMEMRASLGIVGMLLLGFAVSRAAGNSLALFDTLAYLVPLLRSSSRRSKQMRLRSVFQLGHTMRGAALCSVLCVPPLDDT